ncbi:MAG: hypothetical protein HY064_16205 [Bacteroidetes bacterium]|nr:hypothetical protein [Bacteroidota bacterium]
MKKIFAIIPFLFFVIVLRSQNGFQLEAVGSVSPIILDHVDKITDTAATKDTVLAPPAFTYPVQSKKFETTVHVDTIKAAKLGNEPLNKLYRTYAKIGVGNYSSFTGEFSVMNLRSKKNSWGMHAKHFNAGSGPKDVPGEYSGFSREQVNIFGKTFLPHHVLYGGFDYDHNNIYDYGSAADTAFITKKASRQFFDLYSANASLTSQFTDSSRINHRIGVKYYHLSDRYDIHEDNIALNVTAGRFIRTEHLGVALSADHNRNSGYDTTSNTIIRFVPQFSAHSDKFDASAGFGLYFDITGNNSLTYFLPQASVSYNIINHIIIPYITLGSSLERNNMFSLSQSNPFLLTNQVFTSKNSLHKWELSGGLRGSLSSEINYDVRMTRVDIDNMPFFVNTTFAQDPLRNKFSVVYDNVNLVQVHGQMSWQHYEKIKVIASGEYSQYKMTKELHPWHTPALRLSLMGEYNLADKIIARVNVFYLDGQYAKLSDGSGTTVVQLKGLTDVNVGLEYRYSKFLSGFIDLNNIANQRYERWYGYPTQRFNFMAGLTYTF